MYPINLPNEYPTSAAGASGLTVGLPKAKLKRRWVVSTLKGRPLNLPERTFIGLCEEVGRRMIDVRK